MKLIYHPNEFLERKVQPVDLDNPSFDPKELHKEKHKRQTDSISQKSSGFSIFWFDSS